MDQPSQAENSRPPAVPGRPAPPPPAPLRAASPAAGGDIFDLGVPAPRAAAPLARQDEPFGELWAPPPSPPPPAAPAPEMPAPEMPAPEMPAPAAAASAPMAPTAPAVAVLAAEPEPEHVLFPGMASRESRQRYLAGLASEGLFHIDLTPEPEAPAILATPPAPEPEPMPEPVAAASMPVLEPEAEPAVEEPAPAAVPEAIAERDPEPEPAATATLGELYLRQGYPAEAEQIFRDVLRREPESAAALEGIARLSAPPPAAVPAAEAAPVAAAADGHLEARELLAGYQPAGRSGPAEGRARKVFLLSRYLERIRRGGRRDVS